MSDDWQVGDLAVCVKVGQWEVVWAADDRDPPAPSNGEVCTVVLFSRGLNGRPFLGFQEYGGECGLFQADRFRKIRPDEHTPCEEEFVTLLNRAKRSVSA